MDECEFPEVVDFWPDFLKQKELQEQKEVTQRDCDDFEWEIEPDFSREPD